MLQDLRCLLHALHTVNMLQQPAPIRTPVELAALRSLLHCPLPAMQLATRDAAASSRTAHSGLLWQSGALYAAPHCPLFTLHSATDFGQCLSGSASFPSAVVHPQLVLACKV